MGPVLTAAAALFIASGLLSIHRDHRMVAPACALPDPFLADENSLSN